MQRDKVLVADSKNYTFIAACVSKSQAEKTLRSEIYVSFRLNSQTNTRICDRYIATAGGKANTSQLVVIVQALFHSRLPEV